MFSICLLCHFVAIKVLIDVFVSEVTFKLFRFLVVDI